MKTAHTARVIGRRAPAMPIAVHATAPAMGIARKRLSRNSACCVSSEVRGCCVLRAVMGEEGGEDSTPSLMPCFIEAADGALCPFPRLAANLRHERHQALHRRRHA